MATARIIWALILFAVVTLLAAPASAARPKVYTAELTGVVDPSTAMYISRALKQAERADADAFVILMNTPGGLVSSAKEISTTLLESTIPVIVYVSPSAAQATSAGGLIALSANVIVMAPGTTIGAIHPVSGNGQKMDSKVQEKAVNAVASYARSIASQRGRDVSIAEKMVRNSLSLTVDEALKARIADAKARNLREMLSQVDGRRVGRETLQISKARVVPVERTLRENFLHALAYPDIAYLLLSLGTLGIIIELSNPGAILPGVVGGISLVLAFYSLSILPINAAALVLMALALIMFIADIKVPSHGILTVGGILAFMLGSFMLFDSALPILRASITVIVTMTLITATLFIYVVQAGIRAQRLRVTTGIEGMIGKVAEARTRLDPEGKVFFEGTLWTATSPVPVGPGEPVRVVSMEGLTLHVEPERVHQEP